MEKRHVSSWCPVGEQSADAAAAPAELVAYAVSARAAAAQSMLSCGPAHFPVWVMHKDPKNQHSNETGSAEVRADTAVESRMQVDKLRAHRVFGTRRRRCVRALLQVDNVDWYLVHTALGQDHRLLALK